MTSRTESLPVSATLSDFLPTVTPPALRSALVVLRRNSPEAWILMMSKIGASIETASRRTMPGFASPGPP